MRNCLRLTAAAAVLVLSQLGVEAIYMQQDLEVIPVDRLIQKLERMVAHEPANATLRLNLARAHAMAFATNSEPVSVWRGAEQNGVFFGYSPPAVPFRVADTGARTSAATLHLTAAIKEYEVVARDANNLVARLGLGWCLQQAGERARAIERYRAIIRDGGLRAPECEPEVLTER